MTEQQWLTTPELGDMEHFLFDTERFSKRKMRLVSVACCRRVIRLLPPTIPSGLLMDWTERFVDGEVAADGWDHIIQPVERAVPTALPPVCYALSALVELGPRKAPDAATLQVVDAVGFEVTLREGHLPPTLTRAEVEQLLQDAFGTYLHDRFMSACEDEERVHADFLRDIFGNPFRPVVFSPEWQTDTAVSVARQMYGSRDFTAMPILADALQDAGCDSDEVLNHCRDPKQVHVRGCWVVDLVLGRR